jgi:hypothetical protein
MVKSNQDSCCLLAVTDSDVLIALERIAMRLEAVIIAEFGRAFTGGITQLDELFSILALLRDTIDELDDEA